MSGANYLAEEWGLNCSYSDMKTFELSEYGLVKKKFLDFCNAWSVVNGESNLDSFIMGFRLGAQFAYDTFVNDEAPFKDLLKEC